MTAEADSRQRELPPRASVLVESLRDIGYSLQTAMADVIDNSLTAGARKIELHAETHAEDPAIGILDDGTGMTRAELLEAMRPGSRSPLEERTDTDLGRFGLGLKTASFSQCRRLTVITRRTGVNVLRGLGPGCGRGDRQVDCGASRQTSRGFLGRTARGGRHSRGLAEARPLGRSQRTR